MFSGLLSCHPGASCATLASWRTAAKRGCERWQPAKARRDNELVAGLIAHRKWGRPQLRGSSLAGIVAANFETLALAAMAGLLGGLSRADKPIEN